MTDLGALLLDRPCFGASFDRLELQRLAPDKPLQGDDPRPVFGEQVGSFEFVVGRAGLCLGDPDADQVATDVMSLGERVQGLSRRILRHKLASERSSRRPIRSHHPVHPQGRTPVCLGSAWLSWPVLASPAAIPGRYNVVRV